MRIEKKAIADEIRSLISEADFLVLTNYRGLSAAQIGDMRRQLEGVQARFCVVKNRLFNVVAEEMKLGDISEFIKEPTGIVAGIGDVSQVAKALKRFAKENGLPAIKGGVLDGTVLSRIDIEAIADLPSREIILTQLAGLLAEPIRRVGGVMQQKILTLAYAVQAISDNKSKE